MALRKQIFRGSTLLIAGEAVVYGSSFIRNMILARLLTKADFGIAATFSMVITLLEFSAKLGIARFVVRDKEGSQPEFIAAAHLVQAVVAVLSAILMAAAAWPLGRLFGIPDHTWAVALLAVIPLLRAVQHLDVNRFERELRFGPSMLVEAVPQLMITLAAWPVAVWLGDFRAVLLLLLTKAVFSCVVSHLVAERPYRWQFHREYVMRMLRFGWPLVVNGFLMFGVLHGDQFLVAAYYTMADLGPYAAAAALVMAPTFFFGRVFNSVMLPVLARVQDDPTALRRRYGQVVAFVALFSAMSTPALLLGAEAFMRLVYGQKYAGAGLILAWLAAANAFRNLRVAPAIAALAKGDSQNQMNSNLGRVLALIPALLIAATGQPVWMVACTGLVGEMFACWVSIMRLRRRDGVPLAVSLVPAAWLTLLVAAAGAASWAGVYAWPVHWVLLAAVLGALLGGALLALVLPALRQETVRFQRHLRAGGWRQWLPGAAARPTAP
jgi:O-antigen/teichoic acid export membrane protein